MAPLYLTRSKSGKAGPTATEVAPAPLGESALLSRLLVAFIDVDDVAQRLANGVAVQIIAKDVREPVHESVYRKPYEG